MFDEENIDEHFPVLGSHLQQRSGPGASIEARARMANQDATVSSQQQPAPQQHRAPTAAVVRGAAPVVTEEDFPTLQAAVRAGAEQHSSRPAPVSTFAASVRRLVGER